MIIGIVCDFVLNPLLEEWIKGKIDEIIQRGLKKDACFITMSLEGYYIEIIQRLVGTKHYIVSPYGKYEYPSAICTFHGDINFMVDMADYIVIISNGGNHSEWEKIRKSQIGRIEINYLTKKEKFYDRNV